jgi:hypothetical protein
VLPVPQIKVNKLDSVLDEEGYKLSKYQRWVAYIGSLYIILNKSKIETLYNFKEEVDEGMKIQCAAKSAFINKAPFN